MNIIKIIIGIEIIVLLGFLGIHMLMDMELKEKEIHQWKEIESFNEND